MDRRAEDRTKLYLQIISVFISVISVFFTFVMVCFGIGGAILAFYLSSKTNDVSSNVTNAQLNAELIKVNATLQTMSADIKRVNDSIIKNESKTEQNTEDIKALKSSVEAQGFKNNGTDRAIGKLEALIK